MLESLGDTKITAAYWLDSDVEHSLAFSIHAPSTTESYSRQINKILDAIVAIAQGRDVVLGGDFNLTVSNRLTPERPISKIY